jgi:hypothetical protein
MRKKTASVDSPDMRTTAERESWEAKKKEIAGASLASTADEYIAAN